ncbi:hypothetical protein GCM10027072_09770 [Streptomyces bullii]
MRARAWRFTIEKGQAGAEAVQAVEMGQGPLPVSLAAMVNINVLACDLRKTVGQRGRGTDRGALGPPTRGNY